MLIAKLSVLLAAAIWTSTVYHGANFYRSAVKALCFPGNTPCLQAHPLMRSHPLPVLFAPAD